MKSTKQAGFSGITLLLLLATLLIIAGIGSYLYSKQSRSQTKPKVVAAGSTAYSGQTTSPGGIPGGASGTTTTPAPTATGTTVRVTEAGFSITVPDSLKDLTYHVNNGTVSFSTQSLSAAAASCSANNGGSGAFDTVTKGSGTYKPPANAANGGLIKQYSGFYLAYTLPTGPCAKGLPVATQNLLDDQAQAFYTALSTVTSL